MKVQEKKNSPNSTSVYIYIPKDQLKIAGLQVGDEVAVTGNNKTKRLTIQKI